MARRPPSGVKLAPDKPPVAPSPQVVDPTPDTGGAAAQEAPSRPARVTKVKEKKPKKVREVPDGPKPDRGWRLWLYWLLCRLGRPDVVPRLSRGQERRLMIAEIQDIVASGVRPVISVLNIKSGGKTRVALAIGSELTRCCEGLNVLVAPATENTATGSIVKMAGVSGKGTTMRLLAQNLRAYRSFSRLDEVLLLTRHGVRVVKEDRNSAGHPGGKFGTDNFISVTRTLHPNSGILILDGGNDNIDGDGITAAALRMSDVAVFAARLTDPISVDHVIETYRGLQDDTYQGITREEIEAQNLRPTSELPADGYEALLMGELRPTRDKLATATFAMNCVKGKYTRDQFDLLTRPAEQSVQASFVPPVWEGEGVAIPEDKYLARKGRVAVTDLKKISRKTNDAYLRLTLEVMRDAEMAKYYADQRLAELSMSSDATAQSVDPDTSLSTDEATASGKDTP